MNSKIIELGKGRGDPTDASAYDVSGRRRSPVMRGMMLLIGSGALFVGAGIAYQGAILSARELYRKHEQRVISDVLARSEQNEAKANAKELRLRLAQERDENERLRATIAEIYSVVAMER